MDVTLMSNNDNSNDLFNVGIILRITDEDYKILSDFIHNREMQIVYRRTSYAPLFISNMRNDQQ